MTNIGLVYFCHDIVILLPLMNSGILFFFSFETSPHNTCIDFLCNFAILYYYYVFGPSLLCFVCFESFLSSYSHMFSEYILCILPCKTNIPSSNCIQYLDSDIFIFSYVIRIQSTVCPLVIQNAII